ADFFTRLNPATVPVSRPVAANVDLLPASLFSRRSSQQFTLLQVDDDDDEPEFGPAGSSARKQTLKNDLLGFPAEVLHDGIGILRAENMVFLGGALGVAIGIRQGLDQDVRRDTAEHPERWGKGSEFIGSLGEAPVQIPILAAVYGVSVLTENEELHSVS